uniref:Major capsid protein n=1 Tax=Megaviridae environmental sample TaxID=1737588 RepID=A0A5J6VI65_9VIRU|nr:MAG: major capsid protein [Megaviridae environmental sample]
MGGGIIQLVANGITDLYLTHKPQITFFKSIWKRHTPFSIESMRQDFGNRVLFGETGVSIISHNADLVNKIYVEIILPEIPPLYNTITGEIDPRFGVRWSNKVGYAILERIALQFNQQEIVFMDSQWLDIYHIIYNHQNKALDMMINNKANEFAPFKKKIKLYVPIPFWFCNNIGSSLPMIAMKNTTVQVVVKLRELSKVIEWGPQYYVDVLEDVCMFEKYEIITQGDSQIIFFYYDSILRRLYFNPYKNTLQIPTNSQSSLLWKNPMCLYNTRDYCMNISPNATINHTDLQFDLKFQYTSSNLKLWVDYIYLEKHERSQFVKNTHQYLIEQMQSKILKNINSTSTIEMMFNFKNPVSELVYVLQMKDSYDIFDYKNLDNTPIIKKQSLVLNGMPIFTNIPTYLTNMIQPYCYYNSNFSNTGINTYCFALNNNNIQPSGTCNFSKMEQCKLTLYMFSNKSKQVSIRLYCKNYNVIEIVNGIVKELFF